MRQATGTIPGPAIGSDPFILARTGQALIGEVPCFPPHFPASPTEGSGLAQPQRELSATAQLAVRRLRVAVKTMPGVEEVLTFGNPSFRVRRKAFAVVDHYSGVDCLWLRVDGERRAQRLLRPGWFASPYDPGRVALCCALEEFDWRGLKPLLRESFDLARGK